MDSGDLFQLIILFLFLCLSAFFSSAETALTTVNRIRIRSMAEEGNAKAALILQMTEDPGKVLSTILIGNNIVNLSASALATSLTIHLLGSYAIGAATGILTFLVLIFGEIAPKTMASLRAEKLSLAYCRPIYFLSLLLTPVIFLINTCSGLVLKLFGVRAEEHEDSLTEEEFRTLIDVSHEDGVLEKDEHMMVHNVLDLGDSKAHEVMVPRVHMVMLDAACTADEIRELYEEYHFTRYPVYEESTENIIGILNIKDLLFLQSGEPFDLHRYLRDAFYTYESKNISELLLEMRKDSYNLAIVLDEYGEMAGLLTLEDILEEIVGEIHDEYDQDEEFPIVKISDREYLADGSLNLDDFCEELGVFLESEDYESLGGFIIEALDRLPVLNDHITTADGISLTVVSMDEKRIDKVRVVLPEKE